MEHKDNTMSPDLPTACLAVISLLLTLPACCVPAPAVVGKVALPAGVVHETGVEGKVVERGTGKPLAGIPLKLYYGSPVATSRPNGSFRLVSKKAGEDLILSGTEAGVLADWFVYSCDIVLKPRQTVKGVTVEAAKGGVLEVSVTDRKTGRPVTRAEAYISPGDDKIRPIIQTTNVDGLASIRLPVGSHKLASVGKDTKYAREDIGRKIEVTEGWHEKLNVSLAPARKLRGKVVDEAGKPVAGAHIMARETTGGGTTDSAGRFEFTWDPCNMGWDPCNSRGIDLLVLETRHEQRNLCALQEVADGNQDVLVTLGPALRVFGFVTDPDGSPVSSASVWYKHSIKINANGRYEIRGILPGSTDKIDVQAAGYGRSVANIDQAAVPPGPVQVPTIVLERADLSIAGTVKDEDGKPLVGAKVYVQGDYLPSFMPAWTDEQGKFRIDGLCKGAIDLVVMDKERKVRFFELVSPGDMNITATVGNRDIWGRP